MSMMTVCLMILSGTMYCNAGWAKSVEHKVKDWFQDAWDSLKKGVDDLGDNFEDIQAYLDDYDWKGMIEHKATSGPAMLKHLELNDNGRVIVVKPGEEIHAEVKCELDSEKCSNFGMYRVVVGLKDDGPQAVLGNEPGFAAGKSREKFTLVAPEKPGFYQIRFRAVDAFLRTTAKDAWKDDDGNEPDAKTTIGIIYVK